MSRPFLNASAALFWRGVLADMAARDRLRELRRADVERVLTDEERAEYRRLCKEANR